jgi:5-methyltetrahydrofolate--homocysteine methyltransferase
MSVNRSAALRELLKTRVLLGDGAMGTQLILRGLPVGVSGETWNLGHGSDVEAIHRAYVQAGCDLVTTNTFGASTASLERHGLADQARALNLAGAQLARRAAGDQAYVLGDIGPFGGFLEPLGDMTGDALYAVFLAQAEALRDGGADGIIIETMADPAEAAVAVRAAKEASDWPVFATYAFGKAGEDGFRTMMGTTVPEALAAAVAAGADVVGANCGTALDLPDYLRLAEALASAARSGATPVILQPNAGAPRVIDGKMTHPASPADMAALIDPLLKLGLRVIGGCCGTGPQHLAAMGRKLHDARG